MNAAEADCLINPPLIGVDIEDVLCPPIDVEAYMDWLRDNWDELRKCWGGEERCAP